MRIKKLIVSKQVLSHQIHLLHLLSTGAHVSRPINSIDTLKSVPPIDLLSGFPVFPPLSLTDKIALSALQQHLPQFPSGDIFYKCHKIMLFEFFPS